MGRQKKKGQLEEILRSFAAEIATLEQKVSREVAASEQAEQLLQGLPLEARGGERSPGAGTPAPRSPGEEAARATALIESLTRDNMILECNLRDYEAALQAVVHEVQRQKAEVVRLKAVCSQHSERAELLAQESAACVPYIAALREENLRLTERNQELMLVIREAAEAEDDTEYEAFVHGLVAENQMLRKLLCCAESTNVPVDAPQTPASPSESMMLSLGGRRRSPASSSSRSPPTPAGQHSGLGESPPHLSGLAGASGAAQAGPSAGIQQSLGTLGPPPTLERQHGMQASSSSLSRTRDLEREDLDDEEDAESTDTVQFLGRDAPPDEDVQDVGPPRSPSRSSADVPTKGELRAGAPSSFASSDPLPPSATGGIVADDVRLGLGVDAPKEDDLESDTESIGTVVQLGHESDESDQKL